MKINGSLNLSIISEALSEFSSNIETRIMNQNFENNAEKQLLCAKLKHSRGIHKHVNAAALSDTVNKSLTLE